MIANIIRVTKNSLATLLLTAITLFANAQKQPQIQEGSVRAPDNIKIDGKLSEWINTPDLQAHNAADRIFYTVSNDDNNLYLTVRGQGNFVSEKILTDGLIFTISHSVSKKTREKDAGNVSIKFPLLADSTQDKIVIPIFHTGDYTKDPIGNRKVIDSLVTKANKRLTAALKEIQVTGIKEITDPIISIFNTDGIKAWAQFNAETKYVYELAIPLKCLGLTIDNPVKFSYNIKLEVPPDPHPDFGANMDPDPHDNYVNTTTDLWGKYILVKK
jgi:hypothetical protein